MITKLKYLSGLMILMWPPYGALQAQDLTFEFSNPSPGDAPFPSAHVLAIALAQHKHQDR